MKRMAPERDSVLSSESLASVEDETLINALAQALEFAVSEKQGLLQLDSVRERYEGLSALLKFRLAELQAQGTTPSGRVH